MTAMERQRRPGWPIPERIAAWWPLVWWTLTTAAVIYLVVRWALLLPDQGGIHSVDSRTYWGAPLDDPYSGPQIGLPGAYLYSPVFIQVLTPLRLLPWEVFHAIWTAFGIGALAYLVGPIGGALALTFLPFVFRDVFVGNIHLLLGAAIVIGLRYPATWAFPALTKITPGIGLLWFAGQGQWRQVLIGGGVIAALSAASFAIAPELWFNWMARLRGDGDTAGSAYLVIAALRAVAGAALVVVAARVGLAWLVPIAVVIALPILWPDSLAILLACFPLLRRRRLSRDEPFTSPSPASSHAGERD